MTKIVKNLLQPDIAAYVLLVTAVSSLLFVFVAQYGFNLQPCYLCIWQRAPYFIVMAILLPLLFLRQYPQLLKPALVLVALAFLAGLGLAVFHSGIERHWWAATNECSLQPLPTSNLREQLLQTPVARCDQISWTFLGLSMTNWNVLLSLGLLIYSLMVLILWPKQTAKNSA